MSRQRGRGESRPGGQRAPRSDGRPRPSEAGADVARLREMVASVVSEAGYDLEGLSVKRVGRRHLVRITVDGEFGVDLDGVADLSRRIAARLDDAETAGGELVPGEYELEVGSPGVDRPLTAPRHWRRNRGRLARVRVAGFGNVVGRVISADDDGVTLDVDGTVRTFRHAELGKGRVEVEFTHVDAEFGEPAAEEDLGADDTDAQEAVWTDDEGGDEE